MPVSLQRITFAMMSPSKEREAIVHRGISRSVRRKRSKGGTLASPPFLFMVEGLAQLMPWPVPVWPLLLGGEFFLFAFHAHGFEFALFGFVGFHDLGLDLGCRFFELW
jgi:hypothetical protein